MPADHSIMCLIAVLVLGALSASAHAGWLKDLSAGWLKDLSVGRSLNLGYGFSLRVDDRLGDFNDNNTMSLLERHAVRLDYQDYGISVAKARNMDAVEVDLYMREQQEGVLCTGSRDYSCERYQNYICSVVANSQWNEIPYT